MDAGVGPPAMGAFARRAGLPWLGFALLLSLAAASQPVAEETRLGFWTASADDVLLRAGGSDFGSYLRFARALQALNVGLLTHPAGVAVMAKAPHLVIDPLAIRHWPPHLVVDPA